MGKRVALTREQWEALTDLVFRRDLRQAWIRTDRLRLRMPLSQVPAKEACVARFLDPSESENCWGRLTFNHVHGRGQAAMSMKATDDEQHGTTVCEGHHGFSRVGGGWANTRVAINKQRDYLETLYP